MKDVKITIRIDDKEKEMLREFAEKKDVPMSQVIREAIRKYLNQER